MYYGYNSLRDVIQREIESQKSVLNKFPESISRPITQSCSKYLAQFTSFQLPFKSDVTSAGGTTTTSSSTSSSSSSSSSSGGPLSAAAATSSAAGNTASSSGATTVKSQQLGTIQEGLSSGALNELNSSTQSQGVTTSSGSTVHHHYHHQNNMMMLIPENMIQLETCEQVNWVLENLMYGLTLSHDYQDTIKDCWNVYHDWLCVLLDEPKPFLPQPIRDDPIVYARKMLWHLYHLFVPRKDSQAPTKHIMMCHGVLILIEGIAKDSKLLKRDLWEEFLKFFLAINDAVLAPAFNKDDFGEILSSRIVATLFEIWLIACNRVFPSPSLWKTFQELCANWRHHVSLVIEWNRVCHALTNRLLELTWWPDMCTQTASRNQPSNDTNVAYDIQTIIGQMNIETVIQAWFRFLHIIGRPVDFCDHHAISKTLEMVRLNRLAGLTKDGSVTGTSSSGGGGGGNTASLDPSVTPTANFPCVKRLPIIYLEVIKGISRIVDAFLGQNTTSTLFQLVQQHQQHMYLNKQLNIGSISTTTTSSTTSVSFDQKSRSKSVLVTPTTTTQLTNEMSSNLSTGSLASNASNARLNPYRLNRTSVNSLLHLVGQWLFEAASITSKEYILGQAESYGILCKIFSSVRTNETISLDYLSRFYALLIQGLRVPSNLGELNSSTMEYDGGELLASIIVNGCNLFKLDFDGSSVVLLPMLNALHAVFKLKYTMREEPNRPKELMKSVFNIGAQSVTLVELKRYCIIIFNSLLSMPNHFGQVTLSETGLTYYSLRTKILEIFLAAMQNEQDTVNLQMLFGCGRLIVGEWALDESTKTSSEVAALDKKERASYCYNQIVSLICAPLKIVNTTLQNHSFALSIFDSLASIAAAGDYLTGASGEDDSICKLAISWIWHYVKMQIRRRSRDHTREMHSVIVAAYNCLIVLLITKPSVLKDKNCLQTVANCIEIGISGSSSYPEQQKLREDASSTSANMQGGSGGVGGPSSSTSGSGSGKESTPTGTSGISSSSSNNPGSVGSSSMGGSANSSSTSGAASGGPGGPTSGSAGSGSGGGAGGNSANATSTLLKAEKELKPASLRVKEAAECVLYYLMEHTSSAAGIWSDNNHDLTRVALDEKSLIDLTAKPANTKFKYFAVDGSLIVAILEKPLVKTPISSLCPTVTIIIRGAFGRQAWSLHLRTNPFSDLENISVDSKGNAIPRALFMMNSIIESNRNGVGNNGYHHHHHHRHNMMRGGGDNSTLKPSNVMNTGGGGGGDTNSSNGDGNSINKLIARPKCEMSIPSLSDVAENCVGAQLGRFQKLKEDQIDFELCAINRVLGENDTYKNKQFGANYESLLSTRNCNDFQSARMLLSHLGYCSLARDVVVGSSSSSSSSDVSEIYSLDGNDVNFQDHLQLLDSLPTRTFTYSTIFYVKANQTSAKAILNNINLDEHLDENFYMFVHSLGSILDVNDLAKRGKLVSQQPNKDVDSSSTTSYTRKLSKINGTENILYWSDISSEICFTIPNGSTLSSESITPPGDDSNRAKYQSIPGDIRVLIVWLEQFQDADQIPIDELISETNHMGDTITPQQQQKQREVIVIFIHPLKNRLNRVSLWSSAARRHFYTMPLIDGMVVGSKMLSSMVRQTVLNIFRRKRLEIDDYQPPHVKRKNKITEMIKKHQAKKSEPDFFTSLLMGT